MGIGLTLEYIKKKTEELAKGYTCLNSEYKNNYTKLEFRCNKDHIFRMRWADFQQGCRCPECAHERKRLTIGSIKERTAKLIEGYECLSKKYKNNCTKLKFRCNKGHIFEMRWSSFQSGQRCSICARVKKKTIEEIKEYAKSFRYKCLNKKYQNANQKLKFECPKNHIFEMRWGDFQQGRRCSNCFGLKKKTINEIKDYAKSFEYECISKRYKNSHTKLRFKCNKNHEFRMRWGDFQQGQRCPICKGEEAHIRMLGENNSQWKNYSKEELQKLESYKLNIWQLTNHNYRKYRDLINPLNLPRGRYVYHLDHIYSIADGFGNSVPPEILASPVNLRILPTVDNLSKNRKSDITLRTLYDLYDQFEEEKYLTGG